MPPDRPDKRERGGIGFLGWAVIVGNAWDWARPWWRYASIASLSFTVGTFYGRYRRDLKKPRA